jgi:hypothetical protein
MLHSVRTGRKPRLLLALWGKSMASIPYQFLIITTATQQILNNSSRPLEIGFAA